LPVFGQRLADDFHFVEGIANANFKFRQDVEVTSQECPEAGTTSTSLLDLLRASDEDGWRQFTELYGPLIYSWCRFSKLGPEDSADIMQDVFRAVLVHAAEFRKDAKVGSFRGWLWTITRNKVRDHYKIRAGKAQATGGSSVHRRLLDQPDDQVSDSSHSSLPGTAGLAFRVLKIIQSEVKESTFSAFWRTTIDGVHPSVVAEELQIPVHSVWQARSRVLRRARQLLDS
jgi:RNA polymerase sigma-70 factor (ECF subfamily)